MVYPAASLCLTYLTGLCLSPKKRGVGEVILLVLAYILVLLYLGFKAHGSASVEEYFLADRKFGKTVLFFINIYTEFFLFITAFV